MAELEGYVPGEDKARSVEFEAGSESRLGRLVLAGITAVLGAGTAVIGKLAENSGVDIGDVTINNAAAILVDATGEGDVPVTLGGESVALAAGTQSIGKLGANSGVDIGNVDVASLPGAIQGPTGPASFQEYTTVAIDLAASTADQVLVAAPGAGKEIWVYGMMMMADTAAGTVVVQDDADSPLTGTIALSDEGGFVVNPSGNFMMPWIKCGSAKALEADTGACTVDGFLSYAIVVL